MLVVFVQRMEMILWGQIDPTRCYEGLIFRKQSPLYAWLLTTYFHYQRIGISTS